MKAYLAPKHIQSVNNFVILWFELSNEYTIIDNGLFFCIQSYLNAKIRENCIAEYKREFGYTTKEANRIFLDVELFLTDRNIALEQELNIEYKINLKNRIFSKSYNFDGQNFKIYYQSEKLINYIHPQITHLQSLKKTTKNYTFDVYEENNKLVFFKNKQFIKSFDSNDFHKLQGLFNTELICTRYKKEEHDWIGIFHASTVSNNKQSVMLIGNSGSGKSTLTTILTHNGYHLIADDNTPILKENYHSYYLPAGISIKPGAFSIIKPYIPNFDQLPQSYLRAYKGGIKYIATPQPEKTHVPCKSIILVNYQPNAEVLLETIDAKTALEVLIPDSWISPKPENAKAFLDWISTVTFYKLTYSNNQDAIDIFSTIFENE